MEVKLQDGTIVTLKDRLKWGDKEQIKYAVSDAAKITGIDSKGNVENMTVGFSENALLNGKVKQIEVTIKSIEKDGKVINFTKEWLYDLEEEDGDLLWKEIALIGNKKKENNIS